MNFIDKIKTYICSKPELFTVMGLGIVFYFIFFHNIGAYALMDVDESRYVSMAKDMFNTKDFLTLYLNNEFFFEKPPLYFWGECLSFALFGHINEFTARFPVALYGAACGFLTYFMGRKIVSRFFGVITSLILATSLEFLILARFAILDIVVATCIGFSVCFGFYTYFCKPENKKYFWWLFYIFSGLAVLAKGIPGFVVPFGTMFFVAIISKKFKELFKPVYLLPGILLFLLITLPWHIIMFKIHNPLFWNEYVIKHHLARFLVGEVINRDQPFYFYFLTILWGFFPWILSCLIVWIKDLVKLIKEKSFYFDYISLNDYQKYVLFNAIAFVFTLLFFSSSRTKLITYILPLYLPLAVLGGVVWKNYLEKGENSKLINITNYVVGGILLFAGIGGLFTPLYLPEQLYSDISGVRLFCVLLLSATGLALILFTKRNLYKAVFATYVTFMMLLSGFGTSGFYNVDYKFGQNDLLEYAQYAKEHNKTLSTYRFGHKYSLIYYGEKPVYYGTEMTPDDFDKVLNKENDLVIIQHKKMKELDGKKFVTIMDGRKYALVDSGVSK